MALDIFFCKNASLCSDVHENNTDHEEDNIDGTSDVEENDDKSAGSHDITSQILDYINSPESNSAMGNHEDDESKSVKDADRDSGTGEDKVSSILGSDEAGEDNPEISPEEQG